MPAATAQDGILIPGALYTIAAFRRLAGISTTTQWRVEVVEGLKLPKVRSGGRVYVRGEDGIWWIEERARRLAAKAEQAAGREPAAEGASHDR